MTKQGKSQLPEERMLDKAKLHKRQQRLQERLQKARSAQDRATERLRRTEARLQKRQTRVQRLQERLTAVEQQLQALSDSEHIVLSASKASSLSHNESDQSDSQSLPNKGSALAEKSPLALSAEKPQRASELRQVTAMVEEETRQAIERTLKAENCLEQADSLDDLAHEPELLQAEVAEQEQLHQEEATVETVAAMIIADAAALAAANAEARAEASSAQVQEAIEQARQAEQALTTLRASVQSGVLSGTKAEAALSLAEQETMYARVALAEAEAAEKQDIQDAQDTEAQAEVAEGMAFSADQRLEDTERASSDETKNDDSQPSSRV